jgi:hypothetical protein
MGVQSDWFGAAQSAGPTLQGGVYDALIA